MAHRLTLVLVLLMAAPASAQDREIEAGGGVWLVNPLNLLDFEQRASPSTGFAWTNWYSERSGLTVGVQALPSYDGGWESGFFGHVTWRRRWIHSREGNFTHLGVGGGPTIWIYRYPSDPTGPAVGVSLLYHMEVLTTRRIRDGLSLRAGVTLTPLLHIPIIVQPAVMIVWSR